MQLHLVARLAFKTNSPPHLPLPRASGLGTLTRLLTWNVVWLIFSPANTIQINHYRYSQTFGKFSLLTSLETRRHTLTYIHRQRKSIHYFSTSIPGWHKRGVVGHFSSQEMLCINWYQYSQNIWKIDTKKQTNAITAIQLQYQVGINVVWLTISPAKRCCASIDINTLKTFEKSTQKPTNAIITFQLQWQVGINVVWLIVSPAKTLHINLLNKRILVCSGVEQVGHHHALSHHHHHYHHHHYHISITITITSSWTSSPKGS